MGLVSDHNKFSIITTGSNLLEGREPLARHSIVSDNLLGMVCHKFAHKALIEITRSAKWQTRMRPNNFSVSYAIGYDARNR
ncbi:hypothetical protein Sjap_011073 [Stephania japonica]|uniref:Uncharacterized protein n=1 Tax=Stephania japonica TaxID=461633 RepID=A0AAP0P7R9_9MAGN